MLESGADTAWPVSDERADDDAGNAGGDEHNPDRRVAMATRIADPHLGAVVESDDDNQSNDRCRYQQPDDSAELSPALDDDIAMPSFNNCFPCHNILSLPTDPETMPGSWIDQTQLWQPATVIVVVATASRTLRQCVPILAW